MKTSITATGNIPPTVFNKSYIDNSRISSSTKQEVSYDVINIQFKVILLGDVSVGKTTLFKRFVLSQKNTTYSPTMSVSMDVKSMYLDANTRIKMNIFDTAGQETFRSTTKNYVIGSKGIIFVFSVVDEASFKILKEWIRMVDDIIDINEVTVFIVGNKIDRDGERVVSYEVGERYAKERKFEYVEISAQEGTNVDSLFEKLALEMVKKDNEVSRSVAGKQKGTWKDNVSVGANSLLSGKGFKKKADKTHNQKHVTCC